jgi:Ribbon-helix-helix protein, copG family
MVRTQIQLPKKVHERLKRLAQAKKWSLAEAIRRATEEFLVRFPLHRTLIVTDWKLPAPMHLGTHPVDAERLKDLAQMSSSEEMVLRDKAVWPLANIGLPGQRVGGTSR